MDGSDSRIGQNRSRSTHSEPSMIPEDDSENQEEITDVPWRSLILFANRECTANGLDGNIYYVVLMWLLGCQSLFL